MVDHADIDHTGLTGISSGAVATDAIWDAKGDLAVGTAANAASKLTVGTNGATLVADSTQTTGLRWNGPATVDATIVGDVTMVNATTFYDGPSASFSAGTWLIMAQTLVKVTVTTSQTYAWSAKLWDGSTVYAEAFEGHRAAANMTNWAFPLQSMVAIVTLGSTTTLKVSVQSLRGSSASAIARNETGIFGLASNTGTRLVGYRLY